jgi:tetratricopeptide (TPR) repeat protein
MLQTRIATGFLFLVVTALGYADEPALNKAKRLEALILTDARDIQAAQSLNELSKIYLTNHLYADFMDALRKLEKVKRPECELAVGYYIGLCRYHQLRYLEETKNWQEYFDSGNAYRQELFTETERIVKMCPDTEFGLRSQALNWLQHKVQNDAQAEDSLNKLTQMIQSYSQKEDFDPDVVKEVADTFSAQDEPSAAKSAYNIYVKGLLAKENPPERLRSIAESSLSKGNIDLAQILYERYIELIKVSLTKDNLAKELIAIIKQFATDGWSQGEDPLYAEKTFGVLEGSCGRNYFSEELQYLRAYNLERAREHSRAIEEYEIFVKDFPKSDRLDEVEFKLGIFYCYARGQKEKGVALLQNIAEGAGALEYKAEALYHHSLLNQYKGEPEAAKSGYGKILALVSENTADFKSLSGRTAERLKEIKQQRPIEHNLKTFLDATVGGYASGQGGLEIVVNPYKEFRGGTIRFNVPQLQLETGCLVPELTYLWSGDLGGAAVPTEPEFSAAYTGIGTKVVNLVVLSADEVMGAAIGMAEIYNQKNQ